MQISIQAPAAEIFDCLTDPNLAHHWMPDLISVVRKSGQGNGPGTEFEYQVRQVGLPMKLTGQVLEFEPSNKLLVRLKSSRFSIDSQYDLLAGPAGEDSRTVVIYSVAQSPGSPLPKILESSFDIFLKAVSQMQLSGLKNFCERKIRPRELIQS